MTPKTLDRFESMLLDRTSSCVAGEDYIFIPLAWEVCAALRAAWTRIAVLERTHEADMALLLANSEEFDVEEM
jgi:hypothetical protein